MSSSSSPSPPITPPTSDSECGSEPPPSHFPDRVLSHRTNTILTPSPHPFAASSKADRSPPAYEKKLFTPPTTPPEPKKQIPALQEVKHEGHERERPSTTFQRSPSTVETEQTRWDNAITSAVDRAETKLDLSSANLTYIPSSVIDLKNLVVLSQLGRNLGPIAAPRVFARSTTAPALLPSPHITGARPFLPSRTTNTLIFGPKRQREQMQIQSSGQSEIELYLMRNAIRTLPRELFALDRLVVLSLRQNKLTSLPPAIGKLTRLRELNIANNRLTHLPSEILRLRLTSLHLHPNPFTPPPPREPKQTRHLGPLITAKSHVPTLAELALRIILEPTMSGNITRLEASMTMAEIHALQLPAQFQRVVRASTGHDRASEDLMEAADDMSTNVCPSSRHRPLGKGVRFLEEADGGHDQDAPVFCTPLEERMEWVGMVAGVRVAESPTAWVPVLWRGCSWGCLSFLEDANADAKDKDGHIFEAGEGEQGEEFEFSDEE